MPNPCRRLYEHCSKRNPCGACETAVPAISPTPPDLRAEVRRALKRESDEQFIRGFGRVEFFGKHGKSGEHDFRQSMRWADKIVPVKQMTEAQRRAELGRILKSWRALSHE